MTDILTIWGLGALPAFRLLLEFERDEAQDEERPVDGLLVAGQAALWPVIVLGAIGLGLFTWRRGF